MALLVAAGAGTVARPGRAADEPRSSDAAPAAVRDAVDLRTLLGVDRSFFADFDDDVPLTAVETERLLELTVRLRALPPEAGRGLRARRLRAMWTTPDDSRGQALFVSGMVTYVERLALPPALGEKFARAEWYRCEIVGLTGIRLVAYTLTVPQPWPLGVPLGERCFLEAAFVKRLPAWEADGAFPDDDLDAVLRLASETLLVAAMRLAWFPQNVLGGLGMDFSLFDAVRDGDAAEPDECLFQMLAAVGRAGDGLIEKNAREQFHERLEFFERVARNPHQARKDRVAARRAIDRAAEGADDVVPLFDQPQSQRGRLVSLVGDARRARELLLDDPRVVERVGFDRYFEVEMVTADSRARPIVCCLLKLPADLPLGDSIDARVRLAGFFLKTRADDASPAVAVPVVVAKSLQRLPGTAPGPSRPVVVAGLAAAMAIVALAAWLARAAWARRLRGVEVEERLALDDAGEGLARDHDSARWRPGSDASAP